MASLSRKGGSLTDYLKSRTAPDNTTWVTIIDHDDLRLVVMVCTGIVAETVERVEPLKPHSEKAQGAPPAPGEREVPHSVQRKSDRFAVAVAIPLSDVDHYTVFGERPLNRAQFCADSL
jgi:hypothetical protein